ncbi:MAG: histidine phosphatase family protein [Cytophagaceae bacterium]
MKKIYLIRHGQTDYNLKGIVQGSGVDTDLNDTGREQARAFYERYKLIKFDKIYISALKRTRQSVQLFLDNGIPYEVHPELNEISWGNKDGQVISMQDNDEYIKMVRSWSSGNLEYRIEGGESPIDVQARQKIFLKKILPRKEESTILICMHGRAIRILLSTLMDHDLSCMEQFDHHNLGLYILNYSGEKFSIEKANCMEHLQDLAR